MDRTIAIPSEPSTNDLADQPQIYSLMAQKDNALNVRIADESRRLSHESYRNSDAMIAIAEDSKQVALSTSKDSSWMLIISALALFYLPPTFTAVRQRIPQL